MNSPSFEVYWEMIMLLKDFCVWSQFGAILEKSYKGSCLAPFSMCLQGKLLKLQSFCKKIQEKLTCFSQCEKHFKRNIKAHFLTKGFIFSSESYHQRHLCAVLFWQETAEVDSTQQLLFQSLCSLLVLEGFWHFTYCTFSTLSLLECVWW